MKKKHLKVINTNYVLFQFSLHFTLYFPNIQVSLLFDADVRVLLYWGIAVEEKQFGRANKIFPNMTDLVDKFYVTYCFIE